jgi:hypothetical protein
MSAPPGSRPKPIRCRGLGVESLEDRTLPSSGVSHKIRTSPATLHVIELKNDEGPQALSRRPSITIINRVRDDGYLFINFN